MLNFIRSKFDKADILLFIVFLTILLSNFKQGYFIIGNDNFSPEVTPSITLERSFFSPAWRTYRAWGIASDSEQADIFRTSAFFILAQIGIPLWLISQLYLFFTVFVAIYSMGKLTQIILNELGVTSLYAKLFGGLLYLSTLLAVWIYFFPVHLFVAVYAFLPFLLWRIYLFIEETTAKNFLFFLLGIFLYTTSALTVTMFLTSFLVLCLFLFGYSLMKREKLKILFYSFIIILLFQLFWLLPLFSYLKSNTKVLQESLINRKITQSIIENEKEYNTVLNIPRYNFSWLDATYKDGSFIYPYHGWFKKDLIGQSLGFLPILFFVLGSLFLLKRKNPFGILLILTYFFGFFLIKGENFPLGSIYKSLLEKNELIAQIFRWQSSKLWPLIALPFPMIGTIGILLVSKKLDGAVRSIYILLITFSLLFYVSPFFIGGMLRNVMYVKIPEDYQKLSRFLRDNDKFSRIFPAPEANTLYFRNYSWGFFGSVFLNYILPNPVIEKALIIGSKENENAFRILTNAYHSYDPKIFANALFQYNIPFVLSDEYANEGETGFRYDWENHETIVKRNPYLVPIWQSGKLILYKLDASQFETNPPLEKIYSRQRFESINAMNIINRPTNYYLTGDGDGIIYPLFLNFDSYAFDSFNKEINATARYTGKKTKYTATITPEEIQNSPTAIEIQAEGGIVLKPSWPSIAINGEKKDLSLPLLYYYPAKDYRYFVLDNLVFEKKEGRRGTVSTPFGSIEKSLSLTTWDDEQIINMRQNDQKQGLFCNNIIASEQLTLNYPDKIYCVSNPLFFPKDTVARIEFILNSNSAIEGTLCVESTNMKRCLNNKPQLFSKGKQYFSLFIPRLIEEGDSIRIHLTLQTNEESTDVNIESFLVKQFSTKEMIKVEQGISVDNNNVSRTVFFEAGDTITVTLPLIDDESSFAFTSEGSFYPNTSHGRFNNDESIQSTPFDGIQVTHRGSFSSFLYLPPVKADGIGMMYLKGANYQGVPADVGFRDKKAENYLWEEKLFSKKESELLDFFIIPKKYVSYAIEFQSQGIGKSLTKNELSRLVFQVVPKEWFGWKLIPEDDRSLPMFTLQPAYPTETNMYEGGISDETQKIIAIPSAVSPYWIINDKKASHAVINGWKQGWITQKEGEISVFYWPNLLVYLGYAVIIIVTASGLSLLWPKQMKKPPASSPQV